MAKGLKYLMRGLSIMSVLTVKLPLALSDGQLTVQEMADLAKAIGDAGGWKLNINVPPEVATTVLGMSEED